MHENPTPARLSSLIYIFLNYNGNKRGALGVLHRPYRQNEERLNWRKGAPSMGNAVVGFGESVKIKMAWLNKRRWKSQEQIRGEPEKSPAQIVEFPKTKRITDNFWRFPTKKHNLREPDHRLRTGLPKLWMTSSNSASTRMNYYEVGALVTINSRGSEWIPVKLVSFL